MSYKISGFSFSYSSNSMQTRGLQLMNKLIMFYSCKSVADYNIPICDSNVCDGVVPPSIKKFDCDLNQADILVFAIAEFTGHYSSGFKNALDWLVVKSRYNNSLGTSYGFSNKPIFVITFTPTRKAGHRHFEMTKHLLEDKMGGKVINLYVKNNCWNELTPNNETFVKKECNQIINFSQEWTGYSKPKTKEYANADLWLQEYSNWNDKWKI